jgi:hypothetical protein
MNTYKYLLPIALLLGGCLNQAERIPLKCAAEVTEALFACQSYCKGDSGDLVVWDSGENGCHSFDCGCSRPAHPTNAGSK